MKMHKKKFISFLKQKKKCLIISTQILEINMQEENLPGSWIVWILQFLFFFHLKT